MPTLVMEPPLAPCRSYSFLYPNNDSLLPRQLLVTRIHDIHEGRKPEAEWLVTGIDLEQRSQESFLFDVMLDVQPIPRMSFRIRDR